MLTIEYDFVGKNNICNCKISNFELMRINNQFICKNKNCQKWKCRCI